MADRSPNDVHAQYAAERQRGAERAAKATAWCALSLLPLFAYLDTVVFPDFARLFLYWRAACMSLAAFVLLALLTEAGRRRALLLGVSVPVAVGLDVDAMTMVAGREASPYYAGVIVVLLAASLLVPWPPSWALATSVLLVGAYAGGILAMGPIGDLPLFLTNTFLLASSGFLVVIGAAMSERGRRREWEARMLLDARARRQETIARLGQLALSAIGSAELMESAVHLAGETLGTDLAEMLEVRPDGENLVRRAGTGWHDAAGDGGLVRTGNAPHVALAMRSGASVVVGDPTRRETSPSTVVARHGVASGIITVVHGRDRAFGVLGVYTVRPRSFTSEEVDFVQSVAAILTTAIVREQAERALTEEVGSSAALARVARELISSLETPVLLQRLCELTAEVLGADYSNTWLADFEEHVYIPIASHGLPSDQWEALRTLRVQTHAATSLLQPLAREEVVYLRPDQGDHLLLSRIVARHGAKLAACVGFRSGGMLVGVQVLGFANRTEELTPQETRLALGIGQLASMALTNARLVEELERASRLKSEFVSTMSHELRTPLNVIIGYTDMLADEGPEDERRHALAQVRRSSLELLELIEATLDLNRIAAGKDVLHLETVNVAALCEELSSDFAALASRTSVVMRWDAPAVDLSTDRRKLKMILKNLIGNALKFTHDGEVVTTCTVDEHGCTFTIRDTGIGIPPEHLPLIFEMFRQVDSSETRSYGGAGLGLYIVRSLLMQLGGEIEVESEVGRGSTFTVRLPFAVGDTARREARAALG